MQPIPGPPFFAVALAARLLCARWTPLLLLQLLSGQARFNDLQRELPRMSPALLSRRLTQLRTAGIVERKASAGGRAGYALTPAGREAVAVLSALRACGEHWVQSLPGCVDADLLVWDLHRRIGPPWPARTRVVRLSVACEKRERAYWLAAGPDGCELCLRDPELGDDAVLQTDAATLAAVWMGLSRVGDAEACGALSISGEPEAVRLVRCWLCQGAPDGALLPGDGDAPERVSG